MCIIIAQKPGREHKRIPYDHFKWSAKNNPDGMGIMWADGGAVHIYRHMDDLDGIWKRYCEAYSAGFPSVIHFRVATKGTKVVDNCHPFPIAWSDHGAVTLAMAHNGTIPEVGDLVNDNSDTRQFAENILAGIHPLHVLSPNFLEFLKQGVGQSKLVFLNHLKELYFVRESVGDWLQEYGSWYSNGSYKERKTSTTYQYAGYVWHDNRAQRWETQKLYCDYCKRADCLHEYFDCFKRGQDLNYCVRCYRKGHQRYTGDCKKDHEVRLVVGDFVDKWISIVNGTYVEEEKPKAETFMDAPEGELYSWKWKNKSRMADTPGCDPEELAEAFIEGMQPINVDSVCGADEWLVHGLIYNGMVMCWKCMPSRYLAELAIPIGLPTITELQCADCCDTIYDPTEDWELIIESECQFMEAVEDGKDEFDWTRRLQ